MAKMSTTPDYVECACGESIFLLDLPADLAAVSGKQKLWVHAHDKDTLCYEDDPDCHAEPYEARP